MGTLPLAGWPILFCRPTQEPCVSHSQHRKKWERFWKKCRWMDWSGRRNPWHVWPYTDLLQGFKGRTFKLCVLTKWDFDFCVRSSSLRWFLHNGKRREHSQFQTVKFCNSDSALRPEGRVTENTASLFSRQVLIRSSSNFVWLCHTLTQCFCDFFTYAKKDNSLVSEPCQNCNVCLCSETVYVRSFKLCTIMTDINLYTSTPIWVTWMEFWRQIRFFPDWVNFLWLMC